jgi:hypothetical protein
MDSHAALIRLNEFELDGRRRKVGQIQMMVADFERLAAELDREIAAEEGRTGNHDPSHFAYSTYAKAAMQRRDNLLRSIAELRAQLDAERAALNEALATAAAAPAEHPLRRRTDAVRPGEPRIDLNQAS